MFLQSSLDVLLDVNKDKFYKALHEKANQNLLMQFAQDKNHRVLMLSRVDQRGGEEKKAASVPAQKGAEGDQGESEFGVFLQGDEIQFSLKV